MSNTTTENSRAVKLLAASIREAFGMNGEAPLGAGTLKQLQNVQEKLAGLPAADGAAFVLSLFSHIGAGEIGEAGELCARWSPAAESAFTRALEAFQARYDTLSDGEYQQKLALFRRGKGEEAPGPEEAAWAAARLWAPEIATREEDAVALWRLKNVRANPEPLKPGEIVLQLNALYTLPSCIPDELPGGLAEKGRSVMDNPGRKVADYDHPVPLFEADQDHELVSCLRNLEDDLAFEKSIGVFPENYQVPVLLSVSVTHENLDTPVTAWLSHLLRRSRYRHFKLYLLTEQWCRKLDRELFSNTMTQFGVSGPYGRHFNALKYASLLFERIGPVRAGFKLDTDEAICSRDLYNATGKSWFTTLCHRWWGGQGVDSKGEAVYLGVNEGEYMNGADIERDGYASSLRSPDVRPPEKASGKDLFFQKGQAHGNATAWYNKFNGVEEFISHPVVKGGGYGITNDGLRRAVPFTWSRVGRAEDQQFYFSALARKVQGIFHPDLRIAHYKGAVSTSEARTEATRLAGDMYRIIQFSWLARRYGVKEKLDPMPGVFAGELAHSQAFFHLIHRAFAFFLKDKAENAMILLTEGLDTLAFFEELIASGEAEKELEEEALLWKSFIEMSANSDREKLAVLLEECDVMSGKEDSVV